jgi:hypothetical protein
MEALLPMVPEGKAVLDTMKDLVDLKRIFPYNT